MRAAISVIVPWCNRFNIGRMLRGNAASFERSHAEVIIVNFGGDKQQLEELIGKTSWDWVRIIHVETSGFNKCCAQNVGANASRADTLFMMDEDIVLEDDTLQLAYDALAEGGCFVTVKRVDETTEVRRSSPYLTSVASLIEFRTHEGRVIRIETNTRYLERGARSGPGLIGLRKEQLLKVKGYNSMIHGRGWGDIDLIARLHFALDLKRKRLGRATHFSHSTHEPWEYDDRTRAQSEPINYARCLENYAHARFFGTYHIDVERWATVKTR